MDSAIASAKRRFADGRTEAGIFDLTLEYLIALWHMQDGKCYYSGIQINPMPCSNWQCSIERIDDNKGYIISNICLEFNNVAKWSLNKIKQVISLNIENDDPMILLEINNALNGRKIVNQSRRKIITNNLGQYICNGCNKYKDVTEFYSAINKGCKECCRLRRVIHDSTIRGHLQKLFSSAKASTKHRNNVSNRTADNSFDITFEYLIMLLLTQRGRCAYSNIKLNYGSTLDNDWVASLERVDSAKGYVKDNVCIICSEFNGIDHTTHMKYSNGGSGNWSKEKFNSFLSTINRQLQRSISMSPYMLELINNPSYVRRLSGNIQLEIVG